MRNAVELLKNGKLGYLEPNQEYNVGIEKSAARLRDEVFGLWSARPEERRQAADTYGFIDGLWDSGPRLGASPALHYQHVMDVIRSKIAR